MNQRLQRLLIWFLYAAILVVGSSSYQGQWFLVLAICMGSLFGMALPKLLTVCADLLLREGVILNRAFLSNLTRLLTQEASDVIPTTRIGKLLYSYPFLFAFELVSLYVVTSSSNWFGKALVLGMGLRLTIDLVTHGRDVHSLRERWFSFFPTTLTDVELKLFVIGSVLCLLFFTFLAIRP